MAGDQHGDRPGSPTPVETPQASQPHLNSHDSLGNQEANGVSPACQQVLQNYGQLVESFEILDPEGRSSGAWGAGATLEDALAIPLCQKLLEAYGRIYELHRKRNAGLATAAHELKTPLSIVAGYIELLLSQKPGPLSERQRNILEDAWSNCLRLQQFIGGFLSLSALETGKVSMKFETWDLNECLSEIFGYWLTRFQSKTVAFYYPINLKLSRFEFDWYKVQQVISNLLDNALRFTPQGGTVWLTAEPYLWERRGQQVSVSKDRRRRSAPVPNTVRVTVSDTGPGISPEYYQAIFEDFFKVAPARERSVTAGLGLAIARRIILAHGGSIWVESELGVGTKFSFVLPLKPPLQYG